MKQFGQNVKVAKQGDKLIIEVDLTEEVGKTNSGNPRIAKTSGFQGYQKLIIGGQEYGLQVGMYKKNGASKRVEDVEL